jgi:hypothetical protein
MIVAIALLAGGVLVMVGAALPWLTLFAGLQGYPGTVGLYGWLVFCAGACAFALGLATWRSRIRSAPKIAVVIGTVLLAFTAWLFEGMLSIVHRPDAVMLVPRPGPGLPLIAIGAAIITAAPIAGYLLAPKRQRGSAQ